MHDQRFKAREGYMQESMQRGVGASLVQSTTSRTVKAKDQRPNEMVVDRVRNANVPAGMIISQVDGMINPAEPTSVTNQRIRSDEAEMVKSPRYNTDRTI